MSTLEDGRAVRCDGEKCKAVTRWPIALHAGGCRASGEVPEGNERLAGGWLCVSQNHRARHFCPRCGAALLGAMSNDLPRDKTPRRGARQPGVRFRKGVPEPAQS